jgi:hypothetical protein
VDKALILATELKRLRERVTALAAAPMPLQGKEGPRGLSGGAGKQGAKGDAGTKGTDGLKGAKGDEGLQGISVVDAKIDIDNSLVLVLSDGREIDAGEVGQKVDGKDTVYVSRNTFSGYNNSIFTKTADYLVTAADYTLLCDASAGVLVISLPAAANVSGQIYNIKKIDASLNAVSIDPQGSETIDGSSTADTRKQYTNISIQSDGSNWYIL